MNDDISELFESAQKKYQAGQLDDAADLYQNVLERQPSHPDALHMLGLTAYQMGQADAAAKLITQAIAYKKPFPDAEANLGTVLMALGRLTEARDALHLAHSHAPKNGMILFNLGNVHYELSGWEEAKSAYEQSIALVPDHAQAWCQLGMTHSVLGDLQNAQIAYERSIKAQPDHSQALYNLANVHRDLGHLGQAEKLLKKAISSRKDYAKAWNSLGTLLGDMGRSHEALEAFDQAVLFAPESAPYASNRLCGLQYIEGISNTRLAEAHSEWYWLHIATTIEPAPPAKREPNPDRKLKVGFVSPDFGKHPVGFLSVALFENTNQDEIETVVFSTRKQANEDTLSKRIRAACGTWHSVSDSDDTTLACMISDQQIDILFDMSGQTAGNKLSVFARKPASIQMSWIGYVGTTGLPMMDYIVGDPIQMPDDAASAYPEKPLCLPNGYTCYTPPEGAPAVAQLPALSNGAITFGCLNNPAKLNQTCLETYSKILLKVPDSRILFRFRGLDDVVVQQPILHFLKELGVDSGRVMFEGQAPHAEFLDTYNRIDIALDTAPYSGGLTTCEALWMGVPTITYPGDTFAGRHAASYLNTAGYPDLIARDEQHMVELATTLADDTSMLSEIRASMRDTVLKSPLCDGPRFAKEFTAAMRTAWQDWCNQN